MLPGNAPTPWDFLKPTARSLGFAGIGVAPAGPVPEAAGKAYLAYVSKGLHGKMAYMARYLEQRLDVRHTGMMSGATAVVVAALPYGDSALTTGFWRFVAAHARGRDYHETVREKLEVVADEIARRFPGSRQRIFVDSSPVMERTWAVSAGVGSIGKHGQIIVPPHGSRVVLGEIICSGTEKPTPAQIQPPFSLCDGCNLCIDSCPTGALESPSTVDASRCLSYWTVENRDETVPPEIAHKFELVFGCDRCSEACPHDAPSAGSALEPPACSHGNKFDLNDVVRSDDSTILELIKGTPLERVGPRVLKRNAKIVLSKKQGLENA